MLVLQAQAATEWEKSSDYRVLWPPDDTGI